MVVRRNDFFKHGDRLLFLIWLIVVMPFFYEHLCFSFMALKRFLAPLVFCVDATFSSWEVGRFSANIMLSIGGTALALSKSLLKAYPCIARPAFLSGYKHR